MIINNMSDMSSKNGMTNKKKQKRAVVACILKECEENVALLPRSQKKTNKVEVCVLKK